MESENNAGITNLLSVLTLGSTQYRSDIRLVRDLEDIGASVEPVFGRDYFGVYIKVLPCHLHQAMDLMAEAVNVPKFASWEIAAVKNRAWDVSAQAMSHSGVQLTENVHAAAFYDSVGLGRSPYDTYALPTLSVEDVQDYHSTHMTAEGAVVVGLGVDSGFFRFFFEFVELEWLCSQCDTRIKVCRRRSKDTGFGIG